MEKENQPDNSNLLNGFQKIDDDTDIFKQMFRHSVIPIIIHDLEMNIINANDAAIDQFGYTREEFLEKSIFELHTESELDHSAEILDEMHHKTKLSVETKFKRKDGSEFSAEATPCKFLLGDKPVIHVYIQDITERKKIEEDLQSSNRKLKTKNEELEQITYITSHDLQEPMRTINSFIGLLNQGYMDKLDDTANMYMKYISEASIFMSDLIKSMLDYNRIGKKSEVRDIDCNKLIDDVQKDLSALIAENNATFEIGQLPVIKGYQTEFRLLFQNLISNAIKFHKKDIAPHIVITAKENSHWMFSVQDNGIGIDPKYKDRIFHIFQRLHLKNEYKGTGIGLAHCRKIVDLHGGQIWVESEPDKGSSFYFTIPHYKG